MYLTLEGDTRKLKDKVELIEIMKGLGEFAELSIGGHRRTALVALLNAERAMLLYIRRPEDHGFHVLNLRGDRDAMQSFRMSSGKVDEYPEHWLCSREEGILAIIHYFDSGHMTPDLDWISQRVWSV